MMTFEQEEAADDKDAEFLTTMMCYLVSTERGSERERQVVDLLRRYIQIMEEED